MRALVFALAVVTSPLGAAMCEVACADHAVAGHHQAPVPEAVVTDHHHHEQMAADAEARGVQILVGQATKAVRALHSPVEDCAPVSGQPATLRASAPTSALAPPARSEAPMAHSLDRVRQLTGGPLPWSSPSPPSRSTIPLRI